MPLPPALAARLAKRGIVSKNESKRDSEKVQSVGALQNVDEEVFAEDYDDFGNSEPPPIPAAYLPPPITHPVIQDEVTDFTDRLVFETSACPNIQNPYHECGPYCKKKWGMKLFEHKSDLGRKHERLLRKYPLPDGWFEVGDPTTSRYYYWHVESGHVSWLPPTHPRASISLPANIQKIALPSAEAAQAVEDLGAAASKDAEPSKEEDFEEPDFEEIERELLKEKKRKDRKREGRSRRDRKSDKEKDALDPMDPAAYSDIPRGGWSAGLELPGSAKTGVDSTASGPLFQQRPYPSPGDILRANASSNKDEEDEDD